MSSDVQVFPNNEGFYSAKFKGFESIINSKAIFARILADLVEILLDQSLFLNKFDIGKGLCGKFNRL